MIDRAGAGLYADLKRYFQVDLVDAIRRGEPSPRLLLALVAALPDGSMTQALLVGDRGVHGWSREAAVGADVFDAVYDNMLGTSLGKFKKPPDKYPRPGRRADRGAVPGSVMGLARMSAAT